jgi:1,4-dihydroxy-2-naphthoyl-CoA synthase
VNQFEQLLPLCNVPKKELPCPRAVAQSKIAVRLCGDADLGTAKSIGLEALAMLIGGPEWQEGMNAFMEKREPRFPPLLPP